MSSKLLLPILLFAANFAFSQNKNLQLTNNEINEIKNLKKYGIKERMGEMLMSQKINEQQVQKLNAAKVNLNNIPTLPTKDNNELRSAYDWFIIHSDIVVKGTVISRKESPYPPQNTCFGTHYFIKVDDVIKGNVKVGDTIEVVSVGTRIANDGKYLSKNSGEVNLPLLEEKRIFFLSNADYRYLLREAKNRNSKIMDEYRIDIYKFIGLEIGKLEEQGLISEKAKSINNILTQ